MHGKSEALQPLLPLAGWRFNKSVIFKDPLSSGCVPITALDYVGRLTGVIEQLTASMLYIRVA